MSNLAQDIIHRRRRLLRDLAFGTGAHPGKPTPYLFQHKHKVSIDAWNRKLKREDSIQ
jgi:hypothetical protein